MGKLLVKNKDIVVPGEELAVGMDFLPAGGAFRENDKIIASQLGLVSVSGRLIKLIPLTGRYNPKSGDTVIGKVTDISFSGWYIDIGYAYEANLSLRDATSEYINKGVDLTQYYNFGDVVAAKVVKVTRAKVVDLTMKGPGLRKLRGGKIIEVTPSKVPRIIGKQGSMISIIKEMTNCKIIVGQNGKVWIQGTPEMEIVATEAIMKIEQESHTDGLTDKVKNLLENSIKK